MGYSGAGGKRIHEKNQKQNISWHCPFKGTFWRKTFPAWRSGRGVAVSFSALVGGWEEGMIGAMSDVCGEGM